MNRNSIILGLVFLMILILGAQDSQGEREDQSWESPRLFGLSQPDLQVYEICIVRNDGKEVNASLHCVEGVESIALVTISNLGDNISEATTMVISLNDTSKQTEDIPKLHVSESYSVEYSFIPSHGIGNISVILDPNDVVHEKNETNNIESIMFSAKSKTPIGDLSVKGRLFDSLGRIAKDVSFIISWNDNMISVTTDQDGYFSYMLDTDSYCDGDNLTIVIHTDTGTTYRNITLYSEDLEYDLIITLHEFLIDISYDSLPSSISISDTIIFPVEIVNKGNEDGQISIDIIIPDGLCITMNHDKDDYLLVKAGQSVTLLIQLQITNDSSLVRGYQYLRYEIIITSRFHPQVKENISHTILIDPFHQIAVQLPSDIITAVMPNSIQEVAITVTNYGNVQELFTPILIGYQLPETEFLPTNVIIQPNSSVNITLRYRAPIIPIQSEIFIEVGGLSDYSNSGSFNLSALPYHAAKFSAPDNIEGKQNKTTTVRISVKNSGNMNGTIRLDPTSDRGGIIMNPLIWFSEPGKNKKLSIDIRLPPLCGHKEVIQIKIITHIEEKYQCTLWLNITVVDSFGLDIATIETKVFASSETTIYQHRLLTVNTGNTINTFFFRAEGSHSHLVNLPPPLTLLPNESREIKVETIIPISVTSIIENILISFDDTNSYNDVTLRLYSHHSQITSNISYSQFGDSFQYKIDITNTGQRWEIVTVHIDLPYVQNYLPDHKRWTGTVNAEDLQLEPEKSITLYVNVTTPQLKKYWGSQLAVKLTTITGNSYQIELPKPPIPILLSQIPSNATIEDRLSFSGSHSLWNIYEYCWNFGNGERAFGPSVQYSFPHSGTYDVTLTVIDENGFTATTSKTVIIENLPPIPQIVSSSSNLIIESGQPLFLNATPSLDRDGEIVSYQWTIENENEVSWPFFEYIFTDEGDYLVQLEVVDNHGRNASQTKIFHVIAPTNNTGQVINSRVKSNSSYFAILLSVTLVIVVVLGGTVNRKKYEFLEWLKQIENEEDENGKKITQFSICPMCEAQNPIFFKFCNKCGIAFETTHLKNKET